MFPLLVVVLIIICAKLWSDVGALRARVTTLEALKDVAPQREAVEDANASVATPGTLRAAVSEAEHDMPSAAVRKKAGLITDTRHAAAVTTEMVAPSITTPPDRPIDEVHAVADKASGAPVARATRSARFEDLFGRKLPIWAGGITLAVAGFLIVKYSIDAGLLSPLVRVFMGLLFAVGLIAGAEAALRVDDKVRDPRVRQALSGAGIATLYASLMVATNLYHLISPVAGFVGMALTTLLAGTLSLRFGAPSAVLGLVGGLAAPALVGSASPDVPLLSAYLALTVGGLTALSRTQRWFWLGTLALIGGFGWGLLLIMSGTLDFAANVAIGLFALVLGIILPLVGFVGPRGTRVRLLGSLAACAELAMLVALGGFAPLTWALYGLVSLGIVWLSRREAALVQLPAAGLAVALLLAAAWPQPSIAMLSAVIVGITAIYGLPVTRRMWREAHLSGAFQLAAIAGAIVVLPTLHFDPGKPMTAALALVGAALTLVVATLGWRVAERNSDPRFAILAATTATLVAIAAVVITPAWCAAPVIALVAVAMLFLAEASSDMRIDKIAALFGFASLLALLFGPLDELRHAAGIADADASLTAMLRWLVPALAAAVFAWRNRLPATGTLAQPFAVLLGYGAIAQIVPTHYLALIAIALFAGLAFGRRTQPAIITAAALTSLWAALALGIWLASGIAALYGFPMLLGALPSLSDTLIRLALAAAACAAVAWRRNEGYLKVPAWIGCAVAACVSLHIIFKHLFAIANGAQFIHLGLAERTVWEMLLAGTAVALWRRLPLAAQGLAVASLAHFTVFTLLIHDPLWSAQAVGAWPIANLLLPSFGTAFAICWYSRKVTLSPVIRRAAEWLKMIIILVFVAATLRQAIHGSLLPVGSVGQGEDIARSVILILLAIGFLRHGIAAALRDWRIVSLVLMLAAVAKVFLIDTAGLDGLMRIASFAALGFSLIGVGWLYARFLPEDAGIATRPTSTNAPAADT